MSDERLPNERDYGPEPTTMDEAMRLWKVAKLAHEELRVAAERQRYALSNVETQLRHAGQDLAAADARLMRAAKREALK